MPSSEAQLREQIRQLEILRDQAQAAVANVLDLLDKADQRRLAEGDRPWNRILDNLERTLHLTKARLTKYEQELKERQRELDRIMQMETFAGGGPVSAFEPLSPAELQQALPEGFQLPKDHIRAAERILEMPLDVLGNLTLDEVAEMNRQLLEEGADDAPQPPAETDEPRARKSRLVERIERARRARGSLAAPRRREPSFGERRRQKQLQQAITKVSTGKIPALDLEEAELLIECGRSLAQRAEKSANDLRLKEILDAAMAGIEERAAELRRKRAQMYTRKKP